MNTTGSCYFVIITLIIKICLFNYSIIRKDFISSDNNERIDPMTLYIYVIAAIIVVPEIFVLSCLVLSCLVL